MGSAVIVVEKKMARVRVARGVVSVKTSSNPNHSQVLMLKFVVTVRTGQPSQIPPCS